MKHYLFPLLLALTLIITGTPAAAASRSFGVLDDQTNRTYVPIRFLSEQLQYELNYEPQQQTITIRDHFKTISLTANKKQVMVDGQSIPIDAAPFVQDGITYVPLSAVTNIFGVKMKWNPATASIELNNKEDTIKLPVVKNADNHKKDPIQLDKKTFTVNKRKISTTLLIVDLLHPKVDLSVGIANDKIGSVANLKDIAQHSKAVAAINGTFFDAYTESSVKNPYGYIVVNGEMRKKSSGDKRTIIIFDEQNNVELIPGDQFVERFEAGKIEGALQVGPRLITDGEITVNPKEEGFRDPKILTNGGARSAIGLTRDHKLILLTTNEVTIPDLAHVMKQVSAYQAMNMDGGASSGLYYDGKYLTVPGRKISNALLVTSQ